MTGCGRSVPTPAVTASPAPSPTVARTEPPTPEPTPVPTPIAFEAIVNSPPQSVTLATLEADLMAGLGQVPYLAQTMLPMAVPNEFGNLEHPDLGISAQAGCYQLIEYLYTAYALSYAHASTAAEAGLLLKMTEETFEYCYAPGGPLLLNPPPETTWLAIIERDIAAGVDISPEEGQRIFCSNPLSRSISIGCE